MDQNNYYHMNNIQPQQPIPPQQPHKNGGILLGMMLGIAATLLVGGFVLVGVKFYEAVDSRKAAENKSTAAMDSIVSEETEKKLSAIEDVIEEYYYQDADIDVDAMTEGMYHGMVDALGDPYSVYYTEEEWEDLMRDTEGIYYGIGAYLMIDQATGLGKISGVIENTPAQEAGLRENDLLYLVDGESTAGMELSEIVSRVKGEQGTKVHLTIYREGESDYLEVDVERRKIESPTVKYEILKNNIGYIQITEFDDVTTDQFTEALAVVKGAHAKGLIIDLRGNPGGSLNVVVDIARQILPKGLIVYTEDKYGEREEYNCDGRRQLDMPLVVLVNGNSASASEILAGAVKDYKVGTLVGTTTFGKGIVQRILPLTDGTALKLTISAYYTPNGNNIHGVGIEPDVICEFDSDAYYDDDVDNQLDKAVEILLGE
ncbi:MAG: S41 family peptidase [Lachnospiraceae bacterium]|nr:S41 family peptidase [Lachnospiraceae bacterium]